MTTFENAKERYAGIGVDVEAGLRQLAEIPISIHCWQGDDVGGFENAGQELGSGLAVTGNYPGKANTIAELRSDLEEAVRLIPGNHRVNLHAIYGDFSEGPADRDEIELFHFQGWIDWCKENRLGMDFNPTCFSHDKAADGFTLAHRDKGIRDFWIEHCKRCRTIAACMGEQIGSAAVTNVWIPDGYKDLPADRLGPRVRLEESLNEIFSEPLNPSHNLDAVESKLFGIGSESYVVGSHEFYFGYAIKNQKVLCLDAGHFHPTEDIAGKISAALLFVPSLLLHISRGVRWDSDHVVLFDDTTKPILLELVRSGALDRTRIGLDFFDASINRIAAWVIGTRAVQKALLLALLEPRDRLRVAEEKGDFTSRLATMEMLKTLPFGEVWEEFCRRQDTPGEGAWLKEVQDYEKRVLSSRA